MSTSTARTTTLRVLLGPLAIAFMLLGCASGGSQQARSDADAPQIELAQQVISSGTLYFRGPIPLTYVLKIHNPLDVPVTLRRLELRTRGSGAYRLNAEAFNLDKTIPPGGDDAIELYTWGRSTGGFIGSSEPVTLLGTAVFETPHGTKARIFTEYLPQPG